MTTNLECDAVSAVAAYRLAYDELIADALRDESDEERAERLELVEAAQAILLHAFDSGDADDAIADDTYDPRRMCN
ncbi:MAG: hypothetical protein ABI068_13395 [Ktedonobacterales bacterium]